MADMFSEKKRSEIMSKIRSKDTKAEVMVRKWLFAHGFRFRKNDKRYPGKPDIVLPKYKTIIFIHGCFWHSHEGCKRSNMPKSNTEYWSAKLEKNKKRDQEHIQKLKEEGWKVIVLWECELKKDAEKRLQHLINQIKHD